MAKMGYKPSAKVMPTVRSPLAGGGVGGGVRVAATNMGPRGFTDAQKAQINKRLKAKVIKTVG